MLICVNVEKLRLFGRGDLPRNLIFDFGGVVVPLTPEVAYERFEQLGLKDARQRLGRYGHSGIFRWCEDGSLDAEGFVQALSDLVTDQNGGVKTQLTFGQCQWAWRGYVTQVDLKRLNMLLELKKEHRVMLLSNTNPFMTAWAESKDFSGDGHGLCHYFDQVYYSYQLHDYKPSPTIFQKVLSEANVKAEDCLFLDDSQANVDAAIALGFQGILVPEI